VTGIHAPWPVKSGHRSCAPGATGYQAASLLSQPASAEMLSLSQANAAAVAAGRRPGADLAAAGTRP
jgi:hypothetical protein